MLTGCRLNEIMTLKWAYVDLEAKELRLPDSKTVAKTVHLGTAVIDRLKKVAKLEDNECVITGKKFGGRLTDLQHPWRRIRKTAGLNDGGSTTFATHSPAVVSSLAKACR